MLLKRIAASSWMGRQLDLVRSVKSWAADELASRTDSSRAKTRELNADLRTRFSRVSVAMDGRYVDIVAHRQASNTGRNDERRITCAWEADQYPVGVDAKAVIGKQCAVEISKDRGVRSQHATPGAELAGRASDIGSRAPD
jgi:hypothetical protein